MKVTLLFPPFTLSNISGPYLSIPLLAGYLRKHTSHTVAERDLNLAVVSNMLSDTALCKRAREKGMVNARPIQYLRFRAWCMRHAVYYTSQTRYAPLLQELLHFYFSGSSVNINDSIAQSNWAIADAELSDTLSGARKDIFVEFLGEEYFKDIAGCGDCIIGFSIAYFAQFMPALTIAGILKKYNPECRIIFGGNTVFLFHEKLEKYPQLFETVDYYILGDGEVAFTDLLKTLEKRKTPAGVKNVIYRSGETVIVNQYEMLDIDRAETPDYTIVTQSPYYYRTFPNNLIIPLRISLGCYWNRCSFCTLSLARYRHRAIEKVIDDIKQVVAAVHPKDIWFVDLSISAARLKKIAAALLENNIKIRWRGFVRFEEGYTYETCKLLARSGCFVLSFGLESGNQRINDLMDKGVPLTRAEWVLANAARAGIRTSVATIVGFPGETEEEAKDTFRFLKKNRKNITHFSVSIFSLNNKSRVLADPDKFGVSQVQEPDGYFFFRHFDYILKSGITREEAERIRARYIFRLSRWEKLQQRLYRLWRKIIIQFL